MHDRTTSIFHLPEHLAAKAEPRLVASDEQHFAKIAESVDRTVADLTERLATARRSPGRSGQAAVERDAEIHRLAARLRGLGRSGPDLCLGRAVPVSPDGTVSSGDIVPSGDTAPSGDIMSSADPVYVGRQGLTDADGRQLLVDWRSPAAEPFFAATPAHPRGLRSRRRYRWALGRVSDYWDEALTPDALDADLADPGLLDGRAAFVASLGESRTGRMRDVLGTIQSDQDAIVRAGSRGALVVEGGPGTGKTVVALHRCAYLLYGDPLLRHRRGGVLVVGPHEPYLDYVADVLPDLGEDGVLTCTLADLVPEGRDAAPETDPEVARLKSTLAMVEAVDAAVRFSEQPPSEGMLVETVWADVWLSPTDWARAFDAPDPGTPHDDALDAVWDELLSILVDRIVETGAGGPADDDRDGFGDAGGPVSAGLSADDSDELFGSLGLAEDDGPHRHGDETQTAGVVRDDRGAPEPGLLPAALRRHPALTAAMDRAWPVLDAAEVVSDLWSVPAYLRLCAPWLSLDERATLRRPTGSPWTDADLPLLDAARHRVGDPGSRARRARHDATVAHEREYRSRVVDTLVEADDDPESPVVMLRSSDLTEALAGAFDPVDPAHDPLAGPFAHVVVDEAQELTDAQWQMVLRRCPTGSLTVVGDRAQARHGFSESWQERLGRVGIDDVTVAPLTYSYRTPAAIMAEAEVVIRKAVPDANVPVSVRTDGDPVQHGQVDELPSILDQWLAETPDGTACVVGGGSASSLADRPRVRSLTPELTKGLEFDLVVLVGPDISSTGIEGAVDRYVAMTRATQRLVVLS